MDSQPQSSALLVMDVQQGVVERYELTVLSDACADADDEVHRVLTEKVFPRQAEVLTVAEWAGRLGDESAS
jgi:nicotinamidase-related amidase